MREAILRDDFDRAAAATSEGRTYASLRREMSRPRFAVVWSHIGLCYAGLATVLVGLAYLQRLPLYAAPAVVLVGALLIGYIHAALNNFFHEAAHHNIGPTRALNDLLANLFIGGFIASDIADYRRVHFEHHRHHGTTEDPERSYFSGLTLKLLLESVFGIHAIRILARRRRVVEKSETKKETGAPRRIMPKLLALFLHGGVISIVVLTQSWYALGAWLFGVGSMMPMFITLRQILEHRRADAERAVDYSAHDHGAYTRMFGSGLIASTLGSAGFNRHLIHHWDPQLSYTWFRQAERFLLETPVGDTLRGRTTSYLGAIRELYGR